MWHTYIRNRSPTRALAGKTPHEAWTGEKPDVSHFREFRSPVWILSKLKPNKLDNRAMRCIFVGFKDVPKAIKYYDSHAVCMSQNFRFEPDEKNTISVYLLSAGEIEHSQCEINPKSQKKNPK